MHNFVHIPQRSICMKLWQKVLGLSPLFLLHKYIQLSDNLSLCSIVHFDTAYILRLHRNFNYAENMNFSLQIAEKMGYLIGNRYNGFLKVKAVSLNVSDNQWLKLVNPCTVVKYQVKLGQIKYL